MKKPIFEALFVFFVFAPAAIIIFQEKKINKFDYLMRNCELNLPRTEKCVLIAVPESTQGNANEQN